MTDFLQTVKERVVVYDGAMGTNIQFRNPGVDDFWGKDGCNELLVLSRPDIIKDHYCPAKFSGSRTNSLKIRPITHGWSRNDLDWKGPELTSFRLSSG